MIYGLSVQSDTHTITCLFIRIDGAHLQTWWQLHEGGNLEDALVGWWTLRVGGRGPVRLPEGKVLDLIWTLREASTTHRSRF
jgi:hypothetical protein